jgi:hypothetical protein
MEISTFDIHHADETARTSFLGADTPACTRDHD